MSHSFSLIWAQEEAQQLTEYHADKHSESYFKWVGMNISQKTVTLQAACISVRERIMKGMKKDQVAPFEKQIEAMAFDAILRARQKGMVELFTDAKGCNHCAVPPGKANSIRLFFEGETAHPVVRKKTRDRTYWEEKEVDGETVPNKQTLEIYPKLDCSQHQLREMLENQFNVERKAKDSFQLLLKPPKMSKKISVCDFRQLRDLNLQNNDKVLVEFGLLSMDKQPAAATRRIHFKGYSVKPVVKKKAKAGGEFWEEVKMGKDDNLTEISYCLELDLYFSPEDIRAELQDHFMLRKEAIECYDLLISRNGKKYDVANFKHLEDLNLDTFDRFLENPLFYVKLQLKSKQEMLVLSGASPVPKHEIRSSPRLLSNNSVANLKNATTEVNKQEKEAKRRAKAKKAEAKKRVHWKTGGPSRDDRPVKTQRVTENNSTGKKSTTRRLGGSTSLLDTKGNIKSGTDLFPNASAAEQKLLRMLLRERMDVHSSEMWACARESSAMTGNVNWQLKEDGGLANLKKAIYRVTFAEHVGGKRKLTDEIVKITTDKKRLTLDIKNLCEETKFLGNDLRVSSAYLSKFDIDLYWSVAHYEWKNAGVNVDAVLQKILPKKEQKEYWEHLKVSQARRKCRVSAQAQGDTELVIPNDVKNEAALLVAEGELFVELALQLAGDRKSRLKNAPYSMTLLKQQRRLLSARAHLCVHLKGYQDERKILHVAVRYLFYTHDLPTMFGYKSREADGAQNVAKSAMNASKHSPAYLFDLAGFALKRKDHENLLDNAIEDLSELEAGLGSKQTKGVIKDHEKETLLWTRKNMTVALVLRGVSQVELALTSPRSMARGKKRDYLDNAYDDFLRALRYCPALTKCTQVLLETGNGILIGNSWAASDLLSYKRFDIMLKLLMAVTKQEETKLGSAVERNKALVDRIMMRLDRDVDMTKLQSDVTDLSSTTSGNVLSEVDMVGLHKYLDAVGHFYDLRGTPEDAGMT